MRRNAVLAYRSGVFPTHAAKVSTPFLFGSDETESNKHTTICNAQQRTTTMHGEENPVVVEELVPKKNSTSAVWKYFGFSKTDTEQKKVCKLCGKDNLYTTDGNTTGLRRQKQQIYSAAMRACIFAVFQQLKHKNSGHNG